jgi:hypothetical protein
MTPLYGKRQRMFMHLEKEIIDGSSDLFILRSNILRQPLFKVKMWLILLTLIEM